MVYILQELQQAFGTVILINAITKEAHLLGFHGRAATHEPLITKSSHAARLRWCKALQKWTLYNANRFSGVMNQCLIRWQSLSLAYAQRKTFARMHCTYSTIWWRGNYGLGMFLVVCTGNP
ncbi:hypothetical protein TNCV_1832111 [Trichonephila clavipes]|nr:hypothetical protein TNCV_1832111 [Trichonephila clavipes]